MSKELSVTFTVKELEQMLANAKSGGLVEIVIEVNHRLVVR